MAIHWVVRHLAINAHNASRYGFHALATATAVAFRTPPTLLPQGSAFYLGGCALVIYGWTVVGLLVEGYGFWLLFCEFFPTVLQFFRQVPLLSKLLDLPFIKTVSGIVTGVRLGTGGVPWHSASKNMGSAACCHTYLSQKRWGCWVEGGSSRQVGTAQGCREAAAQR